MNITKPKITVIESKEDSIDFSIHVELPKPRFRYDYREKVLLFVYGTLLRGESNCRLFKEANGTFICEAHIYGHSMYDSLSGYPYLVRDVQDPNKTELEDPIQGEIWAVPKELLYMIDRLEGYQEGREHNHYDRVTVSVITEQGVIESYAYVVNGSLEGYKLPKVGRSWKEYLYKGAFV